MDVDGSHNLTFEEFRDGIRQFGIMFENRELRALFDAIDSDHSGKIDYEEFLIAVRVC